MWNGFGLRRIVIAAVAFASPFVALADTPESNTRAVIRGTGKDVTIVYRTSPKAPSVAEPSTASDPLAEALRLKTGGDDDAAVIAFLYQNQAALPDVVDADVVRDFRRAGAGESVISALALLSAVDIGETGEGGPVQGPQSSPEPPTGAYPDLVGMGYPFYGGYGGGYGGGGGYFGGGHIRGGFGKHVFHHRPLFHFGNSFFPKPRPFPTHGSRQASIARRMR
jgi:hypothetical protein